MLEDTVWLMDDAPALVPIGGAVLVLVFFLLHIPNQPGTNTPLKDKLRQLNILGILCLVPGIVCLCLALQWGGTTYSVSFDLTCPCTAHICLKLIELIRGSSGAMGVLLHFLLSPSFF